MKDSDEPLWDGCKNHSKLLVVAKVFIIKSDHELSSSGYTQVNKDDNDEINVEDCDGDENQSIGEEEEENKDNSD